MVDLTRGVGIDVGAAAPVEECLATDGGQEEQESRVLGGHSPLSSPGLQSRNPESPETLIGVVCGLMTEIPFQTLA